ncbi:MAG: DNA topoisomerase IB [Myxococcota bacterium]|nr:DNA topoisomerase IB [Myxococcota bacterium]
MRQKSGFFYIDPKGHRVRDPSTLERIRKLAIPPAWEAVWICPEADGHVQAIGRDARGRKQYRYHARWREIRDETKYHKMIAFADALPRIRAVCERDLARPGLPREKVLATAVRLLEMTHMRVGNEEYTRANGSYGLTTLRDRHVRIEGPNVSFHFRGKSGKTRDLSVHDRRLARIIARCSELPGHQLFHYRDSNGAICTIDSGEVNRYIHAAAGQPFTAKDFRTWAGTVLAAVTLRSLAVPSARGRAHRNIVQCIKTVAAHLGNTPAVCKRSYVHPAVLDAYLDGSLLPSGVDGSTRRPRSRAPRTDASTVEEESFVRAVLERAARTTPATRLAQNLRASIRAVASAGKARAARLGTAARRGHKDDRHAARGPAARAARARRRSAQPK